MRFQWHIPGNGRLLPYLMKKVIMLSGLVSAQFPRLLQTQHSAPISKLSDWIETLYVLVSPPKYHEIGHKYCFKIDCMYLSKSFLFETYVLKLHFEPLHVLLYQLPYLLKQPPTKKLKKSCKLVKTTLVGTQWAQHTCTVALITFQIRLEVEKFSAGK